MPKIKTNKSAAKRFKKTSAGKVKRSHMNTGHILTKKTAKRKRQLRKSALVHKTDIGRVKRMIPY